MIYYDAGRWSISFALQLHGSVVDRCTVLALSCALLAALLNAFVMVDPEAMGWNEMGEYMNADAHQGFSFVLGILIVFRTQRAYSRWCEGGTVLQQVRVEWLDAFSILMTFLNTSEDPEMQAKVEVVRHKMACLFSLLYGKGIEQVHTIHKPFRLTYLNPDGFGRSFASMYSTQTHDTCEMILQWIQRVIVEDDTDRAINAAPEMLEPVYNKLGRGIVLLNNARNIKELTVPFNLAQLIAILLLLHWLSTAIICAIVLTTPAMAGLEAFLVCFCVWGVHFVAVELENPFGDDANDLPLAEMQDAMNWSMIALLRPHAIRPPAFNFDPNRDRDLDKALTRDFFQRRPSRCAVPQEEE